MVLDAYVSSACESISKTQDVLIFVSQADEYAFLLLINIQKLLNSLLLA